MLKRFWAGICSSSFSTSSLVILNSCSSAFEPTTIPQYTGKMWSPPTTELHEHQLPTAQQAAGRSVVMQLGPRDVALARCAPRKALAACKQPL